MNVFDVAIIIAYIVAYPLCWKYWGFEKSNPRDSNLIFLGGNKYKMVLLGLSNVGMFDVSGSGLMVGILFLYA